MTYEELDNVNQKLKRIPIEGKNYVDVSQRVLGFRELFPEGTINTKILTLTNGKVLMRADIRDEKGKLLSTGTAYEISENDFINKKSFIENCETSAVGRALGFIGLGIDGSIASKEELENALLNNEKNTAAKEIKPKEGKGKE